MAVCYWIQMETESGESLSGRLKLFLPSVVVVLQGNCNSYASQLMCKSRFLKSLLHTNCIHFSFVHIIYCRREHRAVKFGTWHVLPSRYITSMPMRWLTIFSYFWFSTFKAKAQDVCVKLTEDYESRLQTVRCFNSVCFIGWLALYP